MFTHHHHQLHLPLNTFSSCVLCGSGISPPGNSLMKTFNKEAEVRTSLLSNSGKPPSSKLFLSSLQHFTDPPTLNRPVSLRPKHKHTFYKYTQPLHTSDKHRQTHRASPQTPLCVWAPEEDPASSVHSSSGWWGAHQTQLLVFPPAQEINQEYLTCLELYCIAHHAWEGFLFLTGVHFNI